MKQSYKIIFQLGMFVILATGLISCNFTPNPISDSDQKKAEIIHQEGLQKFKAGEVDAALIALEKAVKINPESAEIYNDLGNIYFALENPEQALKNYNQAIKLDPSLAMSYYNRGYAYYKTKKMNCL